MFSGEYIFSQVMDHLPIHTFRKCVERYSGNRYVKSFNCFDQFLCMAFGQLTHRESLRDIEICLRAHKPKLYHIGIRGGISRNTFSNANKTRDWRIYADFANALIKIARPLYSREDLGLEMKNTVYALDASTIDLCMSVFPWALFRSTKSAVKLHTLLDLRGNIPIFMYISDVNTLDLLIPETGAFYIMDRGYLDFTRLYRWHTAGAYFVIRAKSNTKFKRRYSRPVEMNKGVICDHTVVLTGLNSLAAYPKTLRRIHYYDSETEKHFNFLTNNFVFSAQTIADQLNLSSKTVNSYRYRMFEKLDVGGDVELTHLAIRHKMIEIDAE